MKSQFDERNATVAIIGGGPVLSLRLATRWLKSPYPILHDPDRAVYRAYGLERAWGIYQRSGTVVIDANGMIRLHHGGANPANALPRAAILKVLEATMPPT